MVNHTEGWMKSDALHEVMRELRASGWLREHAPELDRLYGIPQRVEHHPEVDTGIHIELTLEMAARLTEDPRVRFAALVHDLGEEVDPARGMAKAPRTRGTRVRARARARRPARNARGMARARRPGRAVLPPRAPCARRASPDAGSVLPRREPPHLRSTRNAS